MNKKLFIFGYGYTARYLQDELNRQGFSIIGTNRGTRKFDKSAQLSLIDFNDSEEVKEQLSQLTHILVSTPPSLEGDPTLLKYLNFLHLFKENVKWIGYLSSTSVYGDHQGAWVDETSATQCSTHHAQLRLQAENYWKDLVSQQFPVHIFRLAGIYGPGRNTIDDILNGKTYSIYKQEQHFSRIHVADIVQVILRSIEHPTPGEIFNISDDLPAPSHTVDAYAAKLLGREKLPLIPFTEASLSPMAKEFFSANRKVANTKIKQRLNIKLIYPTFQEGLLAIFNQQHT